MALVEQNTSMIEERDKEIVAIVQSISEINEMYRDLATMVVDQVKLPIMGCKWVILVMIPYL